MNNKHNERKFYISYTANFSNLNDQELLIWLCEPQNSSFQQINNFSISENPISTYDHNANRIHFIKISDRKDFKIIMTFEADLWQNNLHLDPVVAKPVERDRSSDFLKNDLFLEQTKDIKYLVGSIIGKEKNYLMQAYLFSNYLKTNFKYTEIVDKRGVANQDLNNISGDCGEAGSLFVTMCRVAGIPAKNHTGYVIYYDDLKNIYEHGWTSIYLNNIGWIQIDPLAKNIQIENGIFVYEQNNYLLSFNEEFNIPLIPPIPDNFNISYWEDIGLPINRKSSQVIQPLVFASKKPINFSQKVEVK
jgi:hypothetical protein